MIGQRPRYSADIADGRSPLTWRENLKMPSQNPVDMSILISLFNQLQRRGVRYVYGGKAGDKRVNPRSTGRLSTPPDTIDGLDCSGFTHYALYNAAGWDIQDGSQNQLEWFQKEEFKTVDPYSDVNMGLGQKGLYIAFIKPYTKGCGPIGHVWLVYKQDDDAPADTLECHGGGGIDSRHWNQFTLSDEEFTAFELPIA
jgi:hypothetical protein